MSKVYDISGRRKCDGCWKEYATTRRRVNGVWYSLCQKCAAEVDRMKKETRSCSP